MVLERLHPSLLNLVSGVDVTVAVEMMLRYPINSSGHSAWWFQYAEAFLWVVSAVVLALLAGEVDTCRKKAELKMGKDFKKDEIRDQYSAAIGEEKLYVSLMLAIGIIGMVAGIALMGMV
nr:hypothetical protein [Ferrimicrobium acidiphilum]